MTRNTKAAWATLIVVLAFTLGVYHGQRTQCHEITLYSDYHFTCDGRSIQGTARAKDNVTQSWEFSDESR